MSKVNVVHETLVIERTFSTEPHRVFTAYSDVEVRARWAAPTDDEAVIYSESDFRVGGSDAFRCGEKHDLRYSGTTHYEDIVPDERIVFTESIRTGDQILSVSLNTWLLSRVSGGTRLVLTIQIVSFVGKAMVDGSKSGTSGALDNLAKWLVEVGTA